MRSTFFGAVALLIGVPASAQVTRGNALVLGGEPVPGLRGFSVALVQGDLKTGTPIGESVPAAAAKALADLKDFLPYKSYRLLDTQWTMGAGRMTGRLRGPDGKEYDLELQARHGADDATLAVSRFVLREATSNQQGQQGQQGPTGATRPARATGADWSTRRSTRIGR